MEYVCERAGGGRTSKAVPGAASAARRDKHGAARWAHTSTLDGRVTVHRTDLDDAFCVTGAESFIRVFPTAGRAPAPPLHFAPRSASVYVVGVAHAAAAAGVGAGARAASIAAPHAGGPACGEPVRTSEHTFVSAARLNDDVCGDPVVRDAVAAALASPRVDCPSPLVASPSVMVTSRSLAPVGCDADVLMQPSGGSGSTPPVADGVALSGALAADVSCPPGGVSAQAHPLVHRSGDATATAAAAVAVADAVTADIGIARVIGSSPGGADGDAAAASVSPASASVGCDGVDAAPAPSHTPFSEASLAHGSAAPAPRPLSPRDEHDAVAVEAAQLDVPMDDGIVSYLFE
jgi:hypothetical protein